MPNVMTVEVKAMVFTDEERSFLDTLLLETMETHDARGDRQNPNRVLAAKIREAL